MKYSEISRCKAIRTVAILVVGVAIIVYLFLENKGWANFRPQSFCHQAEADADYIYAIVAEYISRPENRGIILKRSEIEGLIDVKSPWTFTTCGEQFFINVVDRSGKCPAEYQSQFKEWNSNIYLLEF